MNQRGFSNIILIILIIITVGVVGYFAFVYEWTTQQPQVTDGEEEIFLTLEYPEEYLIYQDYIRMIGDKPRISDTGTIEVTVISITKSEVCPDIVDPFVPEPKECSIEPYPKDIGVIRIDKIITYIPYSEQTAEQPVEQSSEAEPSEEGKTTPGYRGKELPNSKLLEYEPLQLGQEVPISFLLTARPVKVIYISISPTNGRDGLESEQTIERLIGLQEPLPKTYKPISTVGNYFVFTTKIIEYPGTSQKTFSGLEIGSKFRAEIHYDGTLYIGEYELIQ